LTTPLTFLVSSVAFLRPFRYAPAFNRDDALFDGYIERRAADVRIARELLAH
jgi:hypothetical protein